MHALDAFARRLLDPEDLGHAVTAEVRDAARAALGRATTETGATPGQATGSPLAEVVLGHAELMEISDAISAALEIYFQTGDPEDHEKSYGTLTLLHEVQAKIVPHAFGFSLDETEWGPARAQKIAALRVKKGLPTKPTTKERQGWR